MLLTGIAFVAAAMVASGLLAGPAAAWNALLPVSSSLEAVPSSISFPDSPDFQYRVHLTAGPDGSHFVFTAPQPRWGFAGMQGSPFSIKPPTLDGPGTLGPSMQLVSDPVPWACWRGAYAGNQSWYELTLDRGLSTTIVFDAKAEAASLAGMNTDIGIRLENQDYPIVLHAQTPVGGKPGVRIISQIAGTEPNLLARRGPYGRFRIKGSTEPPLPNRKIQFKASPVIARSKLAKKLTPFRFLTVRTDSMGEFRSDPIELKGGIPATWAITSRLASPGRFARESSCGPALQVGKSG